MKEALLYERLENGCVECNACIRECAILPGGLGYCKTRKNVDGKLFSLYYGYFSGLRVGPISDKPFLHFTDPKTGEKYSGDEKALSVGGYGCNYKCEGCQNVDVSQVNGFVDEAYIQMTPEEVIEEAKKEGVKIIAFTWNEPAIMPEIVVDVARLAQEENLRVMYVSNGSPTKEHLDLILPYIDAFRYDIKSGPESGDSFYDEYCDLKIGSSVQKILEAISYTQAAEKHVELLTVLIPEMEASSELSVLSTAKWISETLINGTPWHLAKFFPANKKKEEKYRTPDSMIDHYAELVRSKYSLDNVYAVKDKGCDCLGSEDEKSCHCSCCHE